MWFRGGALRRGAELSSTMVGGAEQDMVGGVYWFNDG